VRPVYPGYEVYRRRLAPALCASEGPDDPVKRAIAERRQDHLDRQHFYGWRASAAQFEYAVWPVGKALFGPEVGWVHPARVELEQDVNEPALLKRKRAIVRCRTQPELASRLYNLG
jgi:hypothetical protein